MKNAGLDELQGRIKTGRRNINNLRYVGDTTLKAESKEELEIKLPTFAGYRESKGISEKHFSLFPLTV